MFDKALDIYNQNLQKAKEAGDMHMIARNLDHMAEIYYIKGMYDLSINLYNQNLNMAKDLGDQYGMGQTLNNISAIHHNNGEYGYAVYYAIWFYELLKSLNVPEAQRSLDIILSIRDTIGNEDFSILEDNAKRKVDSLHE